MMSVPIVLVTYIANYAAGEAGGMMNAQIINASLMVYGVVFIIAMLIAALYLAPALNRAIQRNEDTGMFSTKDGYDFMKTNKWKWVKVNVWGLLYMAWRLLPYFIPSAMIAILIFVLGGNDILATLLSVSVIVVLVGMVLNITRFIFFKTIIFSKEISARDAVRESMTLGVIHMKDVWKIILAMILLGLAIGVLTAIIGGLAAFAGSTDYLFDGYISPLITLLITTPMLLIMTAKGYVKLRG